MIVYSVTVAVDKTVETEWLEWMQKSHIPAVMDTGFFNEFNMHKILEPILDPNCNSYNILYTLDSMDKLTKYQATEASRLQDEHQQKFGQTCHAFRSILERL